MSATFIANEKTMLISETGDSINAKISQFNIQKLDDFNITQKGFTQSQRPFTTSNQNMKVKNQISTQMDTSNMTPMTNKTPNQQASRNNANNQLFNRTSTRFFQSNPSKDNLYMNRTQQQMVQRQNTQGFSSNRTLSNKDQFQTNRTEQSLTNEEVTELFKSKQIYRRENMVKRLANLGTKMLTSGFNSNHIQGLVGLQSNPQIEFKKKELKQAFLKYSSNNGSKKISNTGSRPFSSGSTMNTGPQTGKSRNRVVAAEINKIQRLTLENQGLVMVNTLNTNQAQKQSQTIKQEQQREFGGISPKRPQLRSVIYDSLTQLKKQDSILTEDKLKYSMFQINKKECHNESNTEYILTSNMKLSERRRSQAQNNSSMKKLDPENLKSIEIDFLNTIQFNRFDNQFIQFLLDNNITPYYYEPNVKQSASEKIDKQAFYLYKFNQNMLKVNLQEAQTFIEKSMLEFGNTPQTQFNLAILYFLKHQYKDATELNLDILQQNPKRQKILLNQLIFQYSLDQNFKLGDLKKYYVKTSSQVNYQILLILNYIRNKQKQIINSVEEIRMTEETIEPEMNEKFIYQQNFQFEPTILNQQSSENIVNFNNFTTFKKKNKAMEDIEIARQYRQSSKQSISKISNYVDQKASQMLIIKAKQYEKEKKQKIDQFHEILDERQKKLRDSEYFYEDVQTKIINEEDIKKKGDLAFIIAPKRSSSLDETYKQLNNISKNYLDDFPDPIDEQYKVLIDDLDKFKNRVDIKSFVEKENQDENKGTEVPYDRPWRNQQLSEQQTLIMNNDQIKRAQSFIKTISKHKKGKTIENKVKYLLNDQQEEEKKNKRNWKDVKQQNEIDQIIQVLSQNKIKKLPNNLAKYDKDLKQATDLDQSLIDELNCLKAEQKLTLNQKLVQLLGITEKELKLRQAILLKNGIKDETFDLQFQRKNFAQQTGQFLDYLYDDYMVKEVQVPGREIQDIFRDSIYIDDIRMFLEKLTETVTSKTYAAIQEKKQKERVNEVWESPLKCNKQKSLDSSPIKRSKTKTAETPSAKGQFMMYFLQKINAMGLLDKIVKDNLQRIKARRDKGGAFFGQVGTDLSKDSLTYLEKYFNKNKELNLLDYPMIDGLLSDLKFFSQFEKEVRIKIYQLCKFFHCSAEKGNLLEESVRKTKYMYVILAGQVNLYKQDYELQLELPLSTLRAGESFGDLSIQAKNKFYDAFISSDNIIARIDSEELFYFKFERKDFCIQIFKEMKEEMYEKIMMLRNAEFFDELSPYALVILASNIQIKEYKLGDVIIKQDTIPPHCFLILEGECRSVYDVPLNKSSKISKYARKTIQQEHVIPLQFNQVDYKLLAQKGKKQFDYFFDLEKKKMEKEREKLKKEAEDGKKLSEDKYSFQNQIIKEHDDSSDRNIDYRHHVFFGKLKESDIIAARALVDQQLIKRHVIDEFQKFAKMLGIQTKEEDKENQQDDELKEQQKQFVIQAKPYVRAVQSKFLHKKMKDFNEERITGEATDEIHIMLGGDSNINMFDKSKLDPSSVDSNSQVKLHNNDELTKLNLSQSSSQASNYSGYNSRGFTQEQIKLQQKMVKDLMKSQVSIVADTAIVKIMVIKKEDKTFLNENLKNIMEKRILNQDFKDFDRPRQNIEEIYDELQRDKNWNLFKGQLEEKFLKDMSMKKQLDKIFE